MERVMYLPTDHTFAVCAYQESPYLENCIRSLLEQDAPTNIIITTATPNNYIQNIAKHYSLDLHVRTGQPDIAEDWNYAYSKAQTSLVTIAHQDDIYCPAYSSSALQHINEEKKPLIFFSNYGEIKNNTPIHKNKLLSVKRLMLSPLQIKTIRKSIFTRRRILSFGSAICCPSVTINKNLLPFPLFQKGFKSDLDWEAWEQASKLKGSFIYDKNILMYHRIHQASATSSLIENNQRSKEDLEMLEKFWPKKIAYLIWCFYKKSQDSNHQ